MLLHFHNPTCAYNQRYNLHQKPFLYFSQFSPPIPPLLVHKIALTISTSNPFVCTSAIFHLPFFVQPSQQSTPKIFSLPQPFFQFMLRQGTRELGSLVRTDTVLISPFFLELWTVITGLTITDSLSLILRKLVYSIHLLS